MKGEIKMQKVKTQMAKDDMAAELLGSIVKDDLMQAIKIFKVLKKMGSVEWNDITFNFGDALVTIDLNVARERGHGGETDA